MKKAIALLLTTMVFAQVSSAAGLRLGNYEGTTDDGVSCSLRLSATNGSLEASLWWAGSKSGGAGFFVKDKSLEGNVLKISGSADIAQAKAKILLANDGTPIEAKMGIGMLVQIGYDINCKNLVLQQSNQ